jgi:hypothetical protein
MYCKLFIPLHPLLLCAVLVMWLVAVVVLPGRSVVFNIWLEAGMLSCANTILKRILFVFALFNYE